MFPIKREDIHICVGDKRHIYKLPKPIDFEFAKALSRLGDLKSYDLGDGTLWFLENAGEIKFKFESGKKELDARFKRKTYEINIKLLEEFMTSYFNTVIQKEN